MRDVPQRAGRREWAGLAVLILPTLLLSIDVTVLHLAVPQLSADLAPSGVELLWINDVYGFLVAGFLVPMGAVGDRIGRRRLLLLGATAFGAASALAAYAPSAGLLILARAVLGVAGATLMPSTLALIRNMFRDERQRTVAISLWMTGFTGGMVIGPLVGGVLLEHFWWGSVFLLGVPVMLVLLATGPLLLPEHRDPGAGRVDLPSVALSLTAVIAVIYGLKELAAYGLGVAPVLAVLAGLAVGLASVRRQRRLAGPLLDPELFRQVRFSAALAALLLVILVGAGAGLQVAQYLQLVLGLTPLEAGLWTLPQAVTAVLGFTLTPLLVRRATPGLVAAGGLVLAAGAMLLLTQADASSGPLPAVAGVALYFLGGSPLLVLGTDMVVSSAPPERAGSAAAVSETAQEFGGALGFALLGSIATAVYRGWIEVPGGVPAAEAVAARDTLGGAAAAAGRLPGPVADALLGSAQDAFTRGLHAVGLVGAAIALAAALLCATLLRRAAPAGAGADEPAGGEAAPTVAEGDRA